MQGPEIEAEFAARLRRAREEHALTLAQVSEQLRAVHGIDVDPSGINRMEKGARSPRLAEAIALADVLDIRLYDMIRPEDYMTMDPAGLLEEAALVQDRLEDLNARLTQAEAALHRARGAAGELRRLRDIAESHLAALTAQPGFPGRGWRGAPVPDQLPIVAAIVTSELGVLVGKRNDGKPPWTFIAGEQEPDEQPEDTAVREVKEETGLEIEAGESIGQRVHPQTGRTMIYLAGHPVHETEVFVGDEAELAEVRWVSLAEADELLPGIYGPVHDYLERTIGSRAD